MSTVEQRTYEFGPFRIDSQERLLYRNGEMIPLTPKVIDTLLALISNAGRVLEKEELLKLIWPDSFVEEGGLARNISILRRVFDEGACGTQFIETIPKRGYRFLAPLAAPPPRAEPRTKEPSQWDWVAPALFLVLVLAMGYVRLRQPAPLRSLVVLPLNNLSGDAPFTEGIHEALINALAQIKSLRVISQTSAMSYQGKRQPLPVIARELDVDAVMEGSVQESDGRVRINVQLFEARTERPLWASSYDKDLRDVLTLQSEVASAIAHEIQATMTPQERASLASSRTVDGEAFRAYARGRFYWNKRTGEGFQQGISYFRRAIAIDPGYAEPYAGLADTYALMAGNGADAYSPREVMPKAKEAALKAVQLDDSLAEGHASLGYVLLAYDWDLPGAQQQFQRAIALNPGYATAHHWYAHYWLAMKQPDKALAEIQRAQEIDPISAVINVGVGFCLYHAHRFDAAIEQYRTTLHMDPGFALAHNTLGMAYQQAGSFDLAIAEFKKATDLQGSESLSMAGLGATYAVTGREQEARALLGQLEQAAKTHYVPAIYRAAIYAALGEKDRGVEWVRKGYEERSDYMIYLKTEPWADPLRSDPRFQEIVRLVESRRPPQ